MSELIVHPHVLAMIICDQVIIDARTGKQSIIGSFSVVNTPSFPLRYPSLMVYIALTEGRGDIPLQLRLIDSNEEQAPVVDRTLSIKFQDPRQVCELHSAFYNLMFPQPGEYRLQLFSRGEPLMERRLLVRQIKPQRRVGGRPTAPPSPPGSEPPPET
jgi:hypothetical protein